MKKVILIIATASLILLITGCQAGTTKEQRLDAFIAVMESGNSANPRDHFAGHPNAALINPDSFNNTDMAPSNNLDITGYSITGNTFSMAFKTTMYPDGLSVDEASFYSEPNNFGGEEWYIKSMTVPLGGGDGVKLIPDDL